MPELPEAERARRLLERTLVGGSIAAVWAAADPIVYEGVKPAEVAAALRGRAVVAAGRWGKHFWLELDATPWLVLHLGISGDLLLRDAEAERPRFAKLELTAGDGRRVVMTNPRRFGRIRLRRDPRREPPIDRLGFDPLHAIPPVAWWQQQLARRRAPIKGVLLDQGFAAGVGNWIADEVLYQAKIAPHRPAHRLSVEEIKRLRTKLRSIVRRAVEVEADARRFPRTWLFHRRWGKPKDAVTTAGHPIAYETVAGRTAAWVPAVQR